MKYVVSSPSRTGSTLLCDIIKSAGVTDILHTHDCHFKVEDPRSTVVCLSLRRNLFRSIMSCLVGKRTKIFNYYDPNLELPKVESFNIDCLIYESEFQRQYRWHKWYVKSHDLTKPYNLVETFYLEDYSNDYDLVYKKLGLTKKFEFVPTVETKYRYQDLVINHEQCKEIYDQLEIISEFEPIVKCYDPNLPT